MAASQTLVKDTKLHQNIYTRKESTFKSIRKTFETLRIVQFNIYKSINSFSDIYILYFYIKNINIIFYSFVINDLIAGTFYLKFRTFDVSRFAIR